MVFVLFFYEIMAIFSIFGPELPLYLLQTNA